MAFRSILASLVLAAASLMPAAHAAKTPDSVGITVGNLGNPFLVATVNGARDKLQEINPDVEVTAVSAEYDLNKQSTQIDNFIAKGVDLILINAVDTKALAPAVKRAQEAGITVAAFDVGTEGVGLTVMTDNVKAGEIACQAIVDRLDGEGNVIIINGPQISSIIDRVDGCKSVLANHPGINILSSNQNGKATRDGGFAVMQSLFTRFQDVDAIFGANDPMALGANLAANQLGRTGLIITGVDGAPSAEEALVAPNTRFVATASQDPYGMAQRAAELGVELMRGNKPDQDTILLDPRLITAENVDSYTGWDEDR